MGHRSALSAARSRCLVRLGVVQTGRCDGDHRSRHGTTITLAERIRRARYWFDPSRMSRPHRDLQRAPSAPHPLLVRRLLPPNPARIFHSTRIAQTHAGSCHPGADESSPSRKSMACITATNVSPPEQYHFPFANVARLLFQPSEDRAIRAPAITTVGEACLWLDRSDLLLAPIQ